ncbi:hypothetical protein EVAR_23243_1 [Eumeta japonica]|uniref:Uncharacterized protein n=1 Tax=Eumeta variegata TaxID=151549 RepID=A0A4C1VEG2_EUMVA|nr:hypothetical protein EVAR_23243_1 [Eumeta japonica]
MSFNLSQIKSILPCLVYAKQSVQDVSSRRTTTVVSGSRLALHQPSVENLGPIHSKVGVYHFSVCPSLSSACLTTKQRLTDLDEIWDYSKSMGLDKYWALYEVDIVYVYLFVRRPGELTNVLITGSGGHREGLPGQIKTGPQKKRRFGGIIVTRPYAVRASGGSL